MTTTKTKNNFYNLNRIKKKNAVYNVIFGERSNGKTYAVLIEGLKEYIKHGGQIAVVRRWKEDITGKRASGIWNAINENEEVSKLTNGEFTGVHYYNSKYYLCNYKKSNIILSNKKVQMWAFFRQS